MTTYSVLEVRTAETQRPQTWTPQQRSFYNLGMIDAYDLAYDLAQRQFSVDKATLDAAFMRIEELEREIDRLYAHHSACPREPRVKPQGPTHEEVLIARGQLDEAQRVARDREQLEKDETLSRRQLIEERLRARHDPRA
jgi:hypothetical protein